MGMQPSKRIPLLRKGDEYLPHQQTVRMWHGGEIRAKVESCLVYKSLFERDAAQLHLLPRKTMREVNKPLFTDWGDK